MSRESPQFQPLKPVDNKDKDKNSSDGTKEGAKSRMPDQSWRWIIFVLMGVAVLVLILPGTLSDSKFKPISYNSFIDRVNSTADDARIKTATIDNVNGEIRGQLQNGAYYRTNGPAPPTEDEIRLIQDKKIELKFKTPKGNGFLDYLLPLLFPVLIILGFYLLMRRQAQGQMGGIMSIGRSKAKTYTTERPRRRSPTSPATSGVKQEITEVVDFLKYPEQVRARSAPASPRACCSSARPGTGKTLIARAVAGEAGVPFLSVTGSDFMEMFVGVGASRVRDLFQTARKHGAGDHLRRRDRLHRPQARRRPRRRPRRARADAQPDARPRWTASRPPRAS